MRDVFHKISRRGKISKHSNFRSPLLLLSQIYTKPKVQKFFLGTKYLMQYLLKYFQGVKFSEYNFLQTLGENYWEILFALERRKHQKEIDPCLLSKFKNIERLKSSKLMPFEGPSEDSDGISKFSFKIVCIYALFCVLCYLQI